MSDTEIFFLKSVQILYFICYFSILDLGIRCLYHAKIIYTSISRKAQNKSDIWSFRGVYGAKPSIVGRMHISHFESRSLACQSSRAESCQLSDILYFRENIFLLHKL